MTTRLHEFDDDPQAEALREGWTALDQLVVRSDVRRMDLAAQTRLAAEIGRRARRARVMQVATLATAACLIGFIAFAWTVRRTADDREPIAGRSNVPATDALSSPASTLPRAVASLSGTRPAVAMPHEQLPPSTPSVVIANDALSPWSDATDQQFESARAYAGEVQSRWRSRSDPWSQVQEAAGRLEQQWNSNSL
ncbi:MAG: hypothetical protein QM775_35330 [Pirellulales bacterium]